MIQKVFRILTLTILLFTFAFGNVFAQTANTPSISISAKSTNAENINVSFSEVVPSGNIIDIEVYYNGNKVFQDFTTNGGSSYSTTTNDLPNGSYTISVGLFTPNWSSNYAWFDKVSSFSLPNNSPSALSSAPSVSVNSVSSSTENIKIVFSNPVPSGNIVDTEVYNSQNQKVFQNANTNGGSTFSATTPSLPTGSYTVSVGLFTPNWSSNYAWFDKVSSFSMGNSTTVLPTPAFVSQTPISGTLSAAVNAYNGWKAKYVVSAGNGMLRVVRPENNNDTVSEGIGYGMVLASYAADQATLNGLWNYGKKYLDSKGLMNWQIDSNGNVIGQGSATDADEDMAYALLRANQKWSGLGYDTAAKSLISAMLSTEVQNNNLPNPGDNWGTTQIVNPSYLAPAYYKEFAVLTGNSRWNDIASTSSNWLMKAANSSTGLLPDWLNADLSPANISFDQHTNDFYYDAVRVPIRLLLAAKLDNDPNAQNILRKESNFLNGIGVSKLTSGYTLPGFPLNNYLDTAFISAFAAAGQVDPSSSYGQSSLSFLINFQTNGYFGTSLRAITLFIAANAPGI